VDRGDSQKTYYQGFSGKGTAFQYGKPLTMASFTDGTSNTILIVEAANAVPWTKPGNLAYSPQKPIAALGVFPDVIHAAFVDGSVHSLRPDFDEKEMRKAIIRDDGEVFDLDRLELPKTKPLPRGKMGPGMGGPFGPGMPGAGRPGGPGMPTPAFSSPKLQQLQEENAQLEEVLQTAFSEMQALRKEMEALKEQFGKRREQAEANRLLEERERLKQQIEQATAELKAMRDELQRLKRGLDKE
jgi:hypothetical protein